MNRESSFFSRDIDAAFDVVNVVRRALRSSSSSSSSSSSVVATVVVVVRRRRVAPRVALVGPAADDT
jgi:hypothetical protein